MFSIFTVEEFPTADNEPIIATAIRAAISPYSIAVDPDSSARKRFSTCASWLAPSCGDDAVNLIAAAELQVKEHD